MKDQIEYYSNMIFETYLWISRNVDYEDNSEDTLKNTRKKLWTLVTYLKDTLKYTCHHFSKKKTKQKVGKYLLSLIIRIQHFLISK